MKKIGLILWTCIHLSIGVSAQNDTTDIYIMHLNDLHAQIQRFPQLKHVVDSIRRVHKNTFLVSAGDLFSGNPFVDKYERPGCPIIKLMKKMHFDVSTIGNHEFDYGQDVLAERFRQASFPFIAANVGTRRTKIPQPAPFIILKTNTISLAFIGLLQIGKNGLPDTHPDYLKRIRFTDPEKAIKPFRNLKKKVDICIALTHLGIKRDKILAQKNPWIDAIIGGHSHTKLDTAVMENGVAIVQAGHNVQFLGLMHIRYAHHKVVQIKEQLIALKHQTPDSTMALDVKLFLKNPIFQEIIADLPYSIDNAKELGEMMTEAYNEGLGTDIAFQNNGGIRVSQLQDGPLKLKSIYLLDPFDNELFTFNMQYKDIVSFLRYAYQIKQKNNQWITGIKAQFITNKQHELVDIKLFDNENNSLDKEKKYKVAMNSYMVRSYSFNNKDKAMPTQKYSNNLIIQYLRHHYPYKKE